MMILPQLLCVEMHSVCGENKQKRVHKT